MLGSTVVNADTPPKKINGYTIGEHLRCYDPERNKVFSHQPYSMTNCGGNSYRISEKDYKTLLPEHNVYENDKVICYNATDGWSGKWSVTNKKYVKKAVKLGLSCGVKTNQPLIAEKDTNKNNTKFNGYIDEKKKQIDSIIGPCSQVKGTLKKAVCLQLQNTFPHRMSCKIAFVNYTNFNRSNTFLDYNNDIQFNITDFNKFSAKIYITFNVHYLRQFNKSTESLEFSQDNYLFNLLNDGRFEISIGNINDKNERYFLMKPGLNHIKFKFDSIYGTFKFEQTLDGRVFNSGVCEERL